MKAYFKILLAVICFLLADVKCVNAAEVTFFVPSNKLVLCTYPFTNTDIRVQAVSNIFRDIKANAIINIWKKYKLPIPGYENYTVNRTGLWVAASGTNIALTGEGIFVRQTYTNVVSITFTGYVITAASYPIEIVPGITMSGYPYPTNRNIAQLGITNVITPYVWGDKLYTYDTLEGMYNIYFYDKGGFLGGGWQNIDNPGMPATNFLNAGEGFVYVGTNATFIWRAPAP